MTKANLKLKKSFKRAARIKKRGVLKRLIRNFHNTRIVGRKSKKIALNMKKTVKKAQTKKTNRLPMKKVKITPLSMAEFSSKKLLESTLPSHSNSTRHPVMLTTNSALLPSLQVPDKQNQATDVSEQSKTKKAEPERPPTIQDILLVYQKQVPAVRHYHHNFPLGAPDGAVPGFSAISDAAAYPRGTKMPLHETRLMMQSNPDELWISTSESTWMIPANLVVDFFKKPMRGREEYDVLGFQLAFQMLWMIWFPAQVFEPLDA